MICLMHNIEWHKLLKFIDQVVPVVKLTIFYLAQRTLKQMSEDEDKEANYVVKIVLCCCNCKEREWLTLFWCDKEPEGNGPLFTEIHFYTRVGKAETSVFCTPGLQ